MATADADFVHQTLKRNVDLFAWTTADVPGVHPDIITPVSYTHLTLPTNREV